MYASEYFRILLYSFSKAAITNYHSLGGLNKTCIVSQFWRLEVQDLGVSRVGKACFRPLPWWFAGDLRWSLAWRHISHICLHVLWRSPRVCVSVQIPFL